MGILDLNLPSDSSSLEYGVFHIIRLKDVAKMAGVSTATASRVLSGTAVVSEDLQRRVLACTEQLNYRPNALARGLRKSQSHTVGILVPDISNPYFMTVARSVEDRMLEHGFNLFLASSNEDWKRERALIEVFMDKRVDGLVVASANRLLSQELRQYLHRGGRVVAVDRIFDDADVDVVAEENYHSAHELVRHLIEMGHKEIALIGAGSDTSTAQQRQAGYLQALQDANIHVREELFLTGDFTQNTGYQSGRQLLTLQRPPTAVFCTNNAIASGFLLAALELQVQIPDDISVVSFGELSLAKLVKPRLTAVVQNPAEVGQVAAGLLLERLVHKVMTLPQMHAIHTEIWHGSSVLRLEQGEGYASSPN